MKNIYFHWMSFSNKYLTILRNNQISWLEK
nr:MAG TPA: hypothetical protein [Caudoviricetes sp.]